MVHIYFIIYSIANFYADFLQREPEESPLAFTDCFFLQKLLPKLYLQRFKTILSVLIHNLWKLHFLWGNEWAEGKLRSML